MAKYLIYKNKNLRTLIYNKRETIFISKYLSLNQNLTNHLKFKTMLKLQKLFNHTHITKIHNRCTKNNYARGVIRLTNLSKSSMKSSLTQKTLTGFIKSS